MSSKPQFGRLRSLLWPVAASELGKFLPMALMVFLIAANYNILKIVKDSTVVPVLGAEVIPYVKVWMMLPSAVVMTAFFSSLVRNLGERRAFYVIIGTFLGYFLIFVFVIYPNRDFFDLHLFAQFLEGLLPRGTHGFASMIRNWHICLFYTMCEIWGTMVLFVLFWGFANKVTPVGEAKRFYALFGLAGNSSGIVSPVFFNWASGRFYFPRTYFTSDWEQTLAIVCLAVVCSGLVTIGIYYYLNHSGVSPIRHVSTSGKRDMQGQKTQGHTSSEKASFTESFARLGKDSYVRNLAIVVLSYNVVINLTEIVWKDQIRQLYPNSLDYGLYFGKVMMVTGIVATVSDLIVCSNVIRRFGWTAAALITPMILLATSVGFFGFLFFDSMLESVLVHLLGISPVGLAAFFGSMQNCLARAAKYSLLDATKEIAFIPLRPDQRIQAKAAIDGVCSRLGKSGGSVLFQCLLMVCGNLVACIPYVAAISGGLVMLWINSVYQMGHKFNELTNAGDSFISSTEEYNQLAGNSSTLATASTSGGKLRPSPGKSSAATLHMHPSS